MVRLKKVFSNANLVCIQLPSDQPSLDTHKYIVNRSYPFQREQYTFEESNSLFVRSSISTINSVANHSFTFLYVFNNDLYKIEGADAIKTILHSFEPRSEILLLLEGTTVHFYSFSIEYICEKTFTRIAYLGSLSTDKLPNCTINNTTKYLISLPLFKLGNYQYTTYMPFAHQNNKMSQLVRFNTSSLEYFDFEGLLITNSFKASVSMKPPRYIYTNAGIFDTVHFQYFGLKKLYTILGEEHNTLSFKPFCTPNGKKFIFISEKPLQALHSSSKIDFPYYEGNFVNGMLYDLDNEEFVFSNYSSSESKFKWLKFFIYDNGIPHIIKIPSEKGEDKFGIIFWAKKKKKFSMIFSKMLPTFVSYICNYSSQGSIDEYSIILRKRIIFAYELSKGLHHSRKIHIDDAKIVDNNKLIVINDELEIASIDSYVQFKAALVNSANSIHNIPIVINKQIGIPSSLEIALQNQSHNNVFHLYKCDNIIVKSYKGDLGNFVLIFLDDNFEIDYSLSFFDFNVFSITSRGLQYKFLKVTSRISDFENETYIINPISKQIFCYEDFVEFVTNHFSKPL